MNHIYKVVWSTVTNSLVVVSELARSKGKAASTVSDVKDVSTKTAAITAAAALQVAAISTIAIGSFAPMEANAIVAIGSTDNGVISSSTVKADGNTTASSYSTSWTDKGTNAYNYNNPGSLSYEDPNNKPLSCTTLYSDKLVHGIAIGCNTNVIAPASGNTYSNGIAIGDYANATGGLSVSLGHLAQSTDVGAMALGTAARASGFNSLAMMRQSAATGDYSVAIGSVAYAKGNASFAMGASATTFGNQSIAIGSVSPVTYDAVNGFEAERTDYDAVNRTQTNGDRSIALGSGAKTSGNDSFSVGSNATTGSFTTTGINGSKETKSQDKADRAIAFGNDSSAKKADAVAFGTKAVANSNSSIAFGGTANATGNSSIAFGINSTTSGNASISIGTNAKAAHDRVITIGTNSTATHNRSMAIGEDAKALANNSLALGSNATVRVQNSVSLGNDSNADEIGGQANMTVNGVKYDFAGLQATGTVSVGSGLDSNRNGTTTVRTITDVGAGRVNAQSTDAINGSQLYAVVTELDKGWNITTSANGGTVSGSQTLGHVRHGETVTFKAGKNINIDQQDQNITVATKDDVTFTSVKAGGTTINDNGLTITGGPSVTKAGINAGDKKITNVADGNVTKDSKEAVNGSQLFATNQNVTNNTNNINSLNNTVQAGWELQVGGKKVKNVTPTNNVANFVAGDNILVTDDSGSVKIATKKDVTFSNVTANNSLTVTKGATINMGDNVVTNVSNGTLSASSKDAVNGSQLFATNQNVTKLETKVNGGFGLQAQDGLNVTKQLGEKIEVIGGNQNINTTVENGKLKVNLNNTLDLGTQGSVKIGDTIVNNDGLTITNGPSVTKTGINAGDQKITNVKAGDISADSKEAVNGSQLFATNQNVTNNTVNITKNAENIAKGTVYAGDRLDTAVTDKTNNFTRALGEQTNIVGGAKGELSDNNLAVISNGLDTLTVKLAKSLTDLTNATFVSDNSNTTIDGNGVTITPSTGDATKVVSLTDKGLNNGNNTITNVADGVNKTDAVNVSQLDKVNATASAGWKLQANNANESTVKPNATVSLNNTDGNIVISKSKDDNNVTFGLNNTITVGDKAKGGNNPVTINGTDGTVTGLTNKDFTPGTIVSGRAATEDQLQSSHNQLNTNITNLGDTLTDKGLNFVGDNNGTTVHRKLGETLSIVGNADLTKLSDKNIGVEANATNGQLVVKLAKELVDLTSANFTGTNVNTTINGNGVTITPTNGGADKAVSLTDKGLNNGNNTITNVAAGVKPTDAVNVSQLEKVNATANAGWNISANGANSTNVGPKGNVSLNNTDGNIVITKGTSDNNVTFALNNQLTIGGKDGVNGADGKDGQIGVKGADGITGVTLNGKDGSIGLTGAAGKDGKNATANISVANGQPGLDGQPGETKTRIVYNTTAPDGTTVTEEVATLNDGLNFVGDVGGKVAKKLNETLSIKGNLTESAQVTDKNLRVDNVNGQLIIKMAKALTDLTSANFTGTTANTTINGNGVTITPAGTDTAKTVSLTDKGLNNGGNNITNVAAGTADTDAVNVSQLKEVSSTANAGWNLTVNGTSSSNVAPKATVDLANKDGNIIITKENNNVTFALNSNLTIGGQDGKDGQIGVKGADGQAGVTLNGKDGSIGLTGPEGANGQPGASANISVANGKPGLDGKDGDTKTRIVYNTTTPDGKPVTEEVATLNDGLNFVGNQGDKIAKKLNETLTVKGTLANEAAASSENLRVDSQEGALVVKLAQNLANLTTATFGNTATDKTVVGKDGVTISADNPENTVSLTDKGLNNGNNTITNVSSGLVGNDGTTPVALKDANGTTLTNAVNVGDLKNTVNDLTNATTGGFGLKDATGTEVKQDLGTSIKVTGKDGVNATVVTDGDGKALQISLNSTVTVGNDNEPGVITVKGENGKDGVSINGKDGSIGLNGKDGSNGSITVAQGKPGLDGNDGLNGESKTRIVYNTTTPDGKTTTEEVATLNDGLNFVGDKGAVIAKKLNETLAIKGNLTATADVTDKNLRVDNENGQLIIKMAKVLTDLTSANFTDAAGNNTVIGGNGVTITPQTGDVVSLTSKGLDNGNNTITNVKAGVNGTDAVNVDQLEKVNATANAGWKLTNNGTNASTVTPNATVDLANKDGNIIITKDGNNVTFGFNNDLTVGGPGKDGQDGKDGTIGVKGADGTTGVTLNGKDGSIGLTGAPGKDGKNASANITVAQGAKGLDGNDGLNGESKTRIVYEKPDGTKEEVATLNDGLNFVGNDGKVIAKKLNDTLAIKGGINTEAGLNAASDRNVGVRENDKGLNIVIAERPTFSGITVDGKDGKDAEIKFAKDGQDGMSIVGTRGADGQNGLTLRGADGQDGVSFKDDGRITNVAEGKDGKDAVNKDQLERVNATANAGWKLTANGSNLSTVTPNATVDLANKDGNIVITKEGNNVTFGLNNNLTVGGPGKDGSPGTDGQIGVKGADGQAGVTLNGKDGSIGLTGAAGKDGQPGASANISVANGQPGLDGQPGETKTRIVYDTTDKNGNPVREEVATLNDGLKFVGDTGEVIAKKLNETLAIKGNLTSTADVTDKNLRVDNEGGQLIIKMAKSLTDLTNATFVSGNSNTTIGGNGLTITPTEGNTVSLTDKGLDNGNNQITNVTSGLADRDGNKVDLANATGDVLNNAVNVGDLKDSVNNLTNATTGGFGLTDENGQDVKADLGKTVTVLGDGSVKTEVVEKDGKKALQIGLTSNVTVGNDKEPGTITVKGEDGKDGVSISGKDGISIKGENGQDAVSISGKDGNGAIAVNGKDGKTGVGLDGANGTIGINGKDGSNGTITVAQGQPGLDGKPGDTKTRIVYNVTAPDGTTVTEEVATLNDGLNFVGNDGKVIAKKLNDTLAIKGNLSSAAEVTANNLRVDNVNGELIIKMAKSLTDLTNATFTNIGGDKSVIEGNGLTITPANGGNTVSLTTKGLDNGGNKVVNVADGDVNPTSTDAVNGSQLYAVSEVANKGWNIQTNGGAVENVKPGDTVNFANGDNIVINNDGKNVTVGLAKDVDLGADGSIKAGDTVMNNDGVKVGDNVSLTKDGLTAGDVKISAETGINAGNKQITNVESGLGGTKLAEAKGDTLKNAANIGDLQTAISGVTDAEQGGGFGLADDNGTEVKQSLGKTIQVKGDGNVKTTVTNGSLTVGLNKDVDLGKDGSLTAGGTKVSDNGVSFADSLVNLTSDGLNNGGNKVTNVKAGDVSATSTDAVNGSQLYATNQNVTNVQNTVAKGWNIEAGTVDGSTGKVTGASKANVAMGDTVGVKAGNNIEITQDGSNIAIATSATPTFDTVTVGKGGNTATVGTVEDQYGSAIKVTGADGKSEIRINNVADGKADNDAVNVRQLKGVAQNVANIDNRVSKLDKRVRGIGANSAAASSLPQVYIPGKSMVAVAGGAYSGASAVAVGYSRASDNGKLILKVNGTANSAGHYSGGVGVGYQW